MPDSAGSVLIVGAGPSGLTLAGELARRGIGCRLIEQREARQDRSKAITLHARTLEIFEDLGIIGEVLALGAPAGAISVWHSTSRSARAAGAPHRLVQMTMGALPAPHPIQLNLHQHETERLLEARAARYGVGLERGVRFIGLDQDQDGVRVHLRHLANDRIETARFDWVVGCDGVNSSVREALGLSFEGTRYPESYLLADVRIDWGLSHDDAQLLLSPYGTLMGMPLAGGLWRIVADFNLDKDGGREPEPTVAALQQLLERRGANGAVLRELDWFSIFRLERRLVDRFRVGRVFVLGDAAHVHSAVLNQGMNTGIGDAYNLGWKLALVAGGTGQPALLDSFQDERMPIARLVLRNSHAATRMIGIRGRAADMARAWTLRVVTKSEAVRRFVQASGGQLSFRYTRSHLVTEDGAKAGRHGPQPGERAPYTVYGPAGARHRSIDAIQGGGHVLLLFASIADPDRYRRLGRIAAEVQTRCPGYLAAHVVVPQEAQPAGLAEPLSVLLDPDRMLHRVFGARTECLYLIRPDGYIAYRSAPADATGLGAYLDRVFLPGVGREPAGDSIADPGGVQPRVREQ
ncbi:MAG: FAD-dependent monooxygenase [Streptosporangiaceae bacterium]|nr:FAD-dependent monooxygenase [Streptosporangiaceae bacterium]